MQTEEGRQYLFVAIDRTSKVVFAELHPRAKRVVAAEFLRRVLDKLQLIKLRMMQSREGYPLL